MTDLTKHRSEYNPWLIGFPFLPATRATGKPPSQEPRSSSWLDRFHCRLHRRAIDRELAAGADPNSSDCRHRRASQLTDGGSWRPPTSASSSSPRHLRCSMSRR